MAKNPERALLIKTLENSKLRRRIQELQEEAVKAGIEQAQQLSKLMEENNALRQTTSERSSRQIEFKIKIRQVQEDNERLREEAVDARRAQYRAEEEIVMVGEKNGRLEDKVKELQLQNERMTSELNEMVKKNHVKERGLENALDNLSAALRENRFLQEELGKLSVCLKNVQLDLRKKQSTIVKISSQLDDASNSLGNQDVLKDQIQKLEANRRSLQIEIQKAEGNKDAIADLLFKNKNLLAENKKLKEDNKNILKQKTDIENDKHQVEEKLKKIANQEDDFYMGKDKLTSSLEEYEVLVSNCNLDETNKMEDQDFSAGIQNLHLLLVNVLQEKEVLKQKILDLENSNFKKLNIIAKLKTNGVEVERSS